MSVLYVLSDGATIRKRSETGSRSGRKQKRVASGE